MNNNKMWVVSPVFYIFSAVMLIMALISLPFNQMLFFIDLFMAALSIAVVAIRSRGFKGYVNNVIGEAREFLDNSNINFLDKVPIPMVILGKSGDIIAYNSLFRNIIGDGHEKIGETISQFLSSETLGGILERNGVDIVYNNRSYAIFGSYIGDESSALYFVEYTEYKLIKQEYAESRPIVAFIFFDNREELKRDSTDGQLSQVSSRVESILREWVTETSGFLKKLNDNKYMMIFEERHMKTFISQKFVVLDKIHSARLDEHRWATVSIGIGRGGSTISEAERWAQSALDMSLGRGGDQVSIKTGDSYEFFGGTSKGVEKRSKVRTRVVAMALMEQMAASDLVFIMGHRFSDLDSIGAAVGMWNVACSVKNKPSYIVVSRENSLASDEINSLEKSFKQNIFIAPEKAKTMITDKTLLIVVDTHSVGFLESEEIYRECKSVVVIDHHRMTVDHISDAVIFYHEPVASSCSEMVTELVQYMGDTEIEKAEAECLLAGIMLDTKNFFLKTGVRTFEAAAYLRKRGADTVEVKKMFSNSIDTYKVRCKVIQSASINNNCAIAKLDGAYGDIRVACAQAADELLGIQNIKASFVIFPYNGGVSISARSLGEVNVQVIMETMGGGGHQTMAAVQLSNISVDQAQQKLIGVLNDFELQSKK